jgi:hypothetical protein
MDLPIVVLLFLTAEGSRMRKIWILSVFVVLMGVNSFDFRCNLPDECLRWEIKKDQGEVRMSQDSIFSPLER